MRDNPQAVQPIIEPWRWRSAQAPWASWVGASLFYALLVAGGAAVSVHFQQLPGVPRPIHVAFGVATAVLLLADRGRWWAYGLAHVLGAGAVAVWFDGAQVLSGAAFAVVEWSAAAVATLVTLRFASGPFAVKLQHVFSLLAGILVGTLVGAIVVAMLDAVNIAGSMRGSSDTIWRSARMWWSSSFVGGVVLVPVLLIWLVRLKTRHPEIPLRSRFELCVLAVILPLIVIGCFEFFAPGASLLPLPLLVSPVLVYAAYRLPPRWAVTLAALTALLVAEMMAHRAAPHAVPDPYLRIGMMQLLMGVFAVVTFLLSIGATEARLVVGWLRDSDQRYRNFVQLSDEAMWRIEIEPPMPVALEIPQQIDWLRLHARVAESSLSFHHIGQSSGADASVHWRQDVPWSTTYEQHLEQAAKSGYSISGLRFSAAVNDKTRSFLTSFSGVVEEGCLCRIWGVARDVTELADLNARLLREQNRLRSYARQMVTAEEKARRATAVDLHDGIGQSLVSMAMILEVARQQAPTTVRMLIEEVRTRLNEVQEHTRRMISDLSPPGLYDLGLGPALQWLCAYLRTREGLRVLLECDVEESAIRLEMRVLVFKLVRELLRNVVKHAGVQTAQVQVQGSNVELVVHVSDQGKGFEWQMDMFGARSGFGLWSIADRVSEVGGVLNVDTRIGQGARFEMIFPLRSVATTKATAAVAASSVEKTA